MRSKGRKKKRKGGVQHSGELLRQVRDLLAESLVAEAEGGAGDAPPLDADEIADLLRERNSAYGRQKRITFVSMVRSALAALRKGEGADSGDGDFVPAAGPNGEPGYFVDRTGDRVNSEPVRLVPAVDRNIMNSSMAAMYKSGNGSASKSASKTSRTSGRKRRAGDGGSGSGSAGGGRRSRKRPRRSASGTGGGGGGGGGGDGGGGLDFLAAPTATFADVGGVEAVLQDVRELIECPLLHPEIYAHLGVDPPRGVLLHGPPGCGKTLLANAIAGEMGLPFLRMAAPEIVAGVSGESEKKIRSFFEEAVRNAPCIVFIDEIDSIAPKRANVAREMERRIVAQLLASMDDLTLERTGGRPVMVLGATNRPEAIEPALRRAGRFDREIALGIPDAPAREHILRVMSAGIRTEGSLDFRAIAMKTPGYVGADLSALTKEAAAIAINRIFSDLAAITDGSLNLDGAVNAAALDSAVTPEAADSTTDMVTDMVIADATTAATPPTLGDEVEKPATPVADQHAPPAPPSADGAMTPLERRSQASRQLRAYAEPLSDASLAPLSVTMDDFLEAIPRVQPSAKREGFATIPNVTWEDVGALDDVRQELEMAILQPIKRPEEFAAFGLSSPVGVLLYGPPGCGKTLLAKAIANQSGANFISIKGPELLNKYVGESERAVRQVFQRGQASAPCVIFFDELDALCPRREGEGNKSGERVVNQLLTEMDGLDARREVFVIAATNRPDIIDPAMLRPGRLDKLLYVRLPTPDDRARILSTITRKSPLAPDVDLDTIARSHQTDGYSGADLAALAREAAVAALRESLTEMDAAAAAAAAEGKGEQASVRPSRRCIRQEHFTIALSKVMPSVSTRDQRSYQRMSEGIRRNRTRPIPAAVLPSADGQPPKASTAASAPAAAATAAVPAPAGDDKPLGSGPLGGETLSGS